MVANEVIETPIGENFTYQWKVKINVDQTVVNFYHNARRFAYFHQNRTDEKTNRSTNTGINYSYEGISFKDGVAFGIITLNISHVKAENEGVIGMKMDQYK